MAAGRMSHKSMRSTVNRDIVSVKVEIIVVMEIIVVVIVEFVMVVIIVKA